MEALVEKLCNRFTGVSGIDNPLNNLLNSIFLP